MVHGSDWEFVQVCPAGEKVEWSVDLTPLKEKNPWAPFDGNIRFDEGRHVYAINHSGVWREYDISVTGLVGSHFKKFDQDYWAGRCAGSRKYPDKSKTQILAEWEANGKLQSGLGTIMHECIEYDMNSLQAPHVEMLASKEYAQYLKFRSDIVEARGWQPFRSELRVFDRELQLAGTIDAVYVRKDAPPGHVILVDWKRSKKLHEAARDPDDCGAEPFGFMSNCDMNKYQLQLNAYRALIERNCPGIVVEKMYLARFHPNFPSHWLVPVKDFQNPIKQMLEKRRLQMTLRREDCTVQKKRKLDAEPVGPQSKQKKSAV